MVANINAAKNEGAQVIIVFTHWGIEKETVPGADQVELGHAAIDAGATIVVGSHPHVIQGYENTMVAISYIALVISALAATKTLATKIA